MRVSVRVPGSSANLGPGFDALAVALDLCLVLELTTDGGSGIRVVDGPDLGGGADLVLDGLRLAAEVARRELPGCALSVRSEIPVARGLGSSAAALVAGLLAGNALLGSPLGQDQIFHLADMAEGHGDNVAASLFGGVALAVPRGRGRCALYRRIPIGRVGALRAVVFIPEHPLLTRDARAVVPPMIALDDAVANAARCALLALALTGGEFTLLGEAMDDRLHQPYRSTLLPYLSMMIDAARSAGAHGACLSGAGPSVLALCAPECAAAVTEALGALARTLELPGRALDLAIVTSGAEVTVAPL